MSEIGYFICPRCQQRAVRMVNTGDFEHDCFGSEVLSNEDVIVIGDWNDYTGSDANVQNVLSFAGVENKLQNTRAGIEGARDYPRTSRGFRRGIYRTRRHIEVIPEEAFKNKGIPETDILMLDKE